MGAGSADAEIAVRNCGRILLTGNVALKSYQDFQDGLRYAWNGYRFPSRIRHSTAKAGTQAGGQSNRV